MWSDSVHEFVWCCYWVYHCSLYKHDVSKQLLTTKHCLINLLLFSKRLGLMGIWGCDETGQLRGLIASMNIRAKGKNFAKYQAIHT